MRVAEQRMARSCCSSGSSMVEIKMWVVCCELTCDHPTDLLHSHFHSSMRSVTCVISSAGFVTGTYPAQDRIPSTAELGAMRQPSVLLLAPVSRSETLLRHRAGSVSSRVSCRPTLLLCAPERSAKTLISATRSASPRVLWLPPLTSWRKALVSDVTASSIRKPLPMAQGPFTVNVTVNRFSHKLTAGVLMLHIRT